MAYQQQRFTSYQFWRPDVQNLGASMVADKGQGAFWGAFCKGANPICEGSGFTISLTPKFFTSKYHHHIGGYEFGGGVQTFSPS